MVTKTFECPICGKSFEGKYNSGGLKRLCSPECKKESRRRAVKRNNDKSKARKFEWHKNNYEYKFSTCIICGKEFGKGNGTKKTCSEECSNKLKEGYTPPKFIITCDFCGKNFEIDKSKHNQYKTHYCSKNCQSNALKNRVKGICLNCGKEFERTPSQMNKGGKYCCQGCMDKHWKGKFHAGWKGGSSFGKYCPKFNNAFKERVRNFFNRKCQICGSPENGKRHAVHHVTYEKDSCCNNKIAMFIPLCTSCHSKTNGNRNSWENILFTYINLYFDGQSYLDQESVTYYE